MMVLAGIAHAAHRPRRGSAERSSRCTRRSSRFVLINLGMGALFLDLTHKLYVWRVYLTFQPGLADVVGLVGADHRLRVSSLASALIRLPEAWPWARPARARCCSAWSDALARARRRLVKRARLVEHRARRRRSASTPGSCSNTMVARPLWNSAILGPLFLFSGLSAGAAMMHLASGRPAARGRRRQGIDRRRAWQRTGPAARQREPPERRTVDALIRADRRVPRDRARADRAAARQSATRRRRRTRPRPR